MEDRMTNARTARLRRRAELEAQAAAEPIGLHCPWCRVLAWLVISDTQALCDNDECRMFLWDPTKTLAQMATEGIAEIDLPARQ
jgi:hypothetical protein